MMCMETGCGGTWGGKQCGNNAKPGCDGYCSLHYPANVEARRKKREEKRDTQRTASEELYREDFENARKARAYDVTLASLKDQDRNMVSREVVIRLLEGAK
jgi:hypothetical protein